MRAFQGDLRAGHFHRSSKESTPFPPKLISGQPFLKGIHLHAHVPSGHTALTSQETEASVPETSRDTNNGEMESCSFLQGSLLPPKQETVVLYLMDTGHWATQLFLKPPVLAAFVSI